MVKNLEQVHKQLRALELAAFKSHGSKWVEDDRVTPEDLALRSFVASFTDAEWAEVDSTYPFPPL